MRPAEKIRRTLVDNGMESTVVETVSHGGENSLIPNPDGKPEPRNRGWRCVSGSGYKSLSPKARCRPDFRMRFTVLRMS